MGRASLLGPGIQASHPLQDSHRVGLRFRIGVFAVCRCGPTTFFFPLITVIFHESVGLRFTLGTTVSFESGWSCRVKAFLRLLLYSISNLLCPGSGVKCLSKGSVLLSALTHSLFSAGLPQMASSLPHIPLLFFFALSQGFLTWLLSCV